MNMLPDVFEYVETIFQFWYKIGSEKNDVKNKCKAV